MYRRSYLIWPPVICEFYSPLLCHTGTSVHLCPPPGYWYTFFFFSGTSGSPPDSTLFLSASLSFTSFYHFFYFCLVPPKLPGQHHHLFFVPSCILQYFLSLLRYDSHLISLALLLLSPIHTSLATTNCGWQPLFLWHVPGFILPFQLSHISTRLGCVHGGGGQLPQNIITRFRPVCWNCYRDGDLTA